MEVMKILIKYFKFILGICYECALNIWQKAGGECHLCRKVDIFYIVNIYYLNDLANCQNFAN